ncbi:hypothetical protein FDP41_007575 [Naegleria fowleri]|uniref:Uncharacterized protein n=1 Tax=Naegleria fowleri TaxID=5763 RepID=A0A6A5CDJ9_NAEFO|nr:uncharacterized protein FDP41_007575 [Naegleria fowleri]KAF0983660.1 hypothetical protein FDP41_007575 [Naegleria fowleri]
MSSSTTTAESIHQSSSEHAPPENIEMFPVSNGLPTDQIEFSLVQIPLPTTPTLNPSKASLFETATTDESRSIHYSSLIVPKLSTSSSMTPPHLQSSCVDIPNSRSGYTTPPSSLLFSSSLIATTSASATPTADGETPSYSSLGHIPFTSTSITLKPQEKASASLPSQPANENPQKPSRASPIPKMLLPPDSHSSTSMNTALASIALDLPSSHDLLPHQNFQQEIPSQADNDHALPNTSPFHKTSSSYNRSQQTQQQVQQKNDEEEVTAKQSFLISIIGCLVLNMLGLGLLCSCVAFYPLLKYKASPNKKARRYGNMGLACFITIFVINAVIVTGLVVAVVLLVIEIFLLP